MRDPNSPVFDAWNLLMATGQMTGPDRPVGRVTWAYNIEREKFSNRPGPWRHELFQLNDAQFEIGGIISISRSSSISDDAGTCTIKLANDYMPSFAYSPLGIDTGIGRPGYLTYNRGDKSSVPTRSIYSDYTGRPEDFPTDQDWDYEYSGALGITHPSPNFYYDVFIPNRLMRTYEGYGSDNYDENGNEIEAHDGGYVAPHLDTKLVLTGTWLIDNVVYSTDGTITIQCRDMAKLLLEQIVYPPMIPLERFPLVFQPLIPDTSTPGSTSKSHATYHSSSVDVWYGHNAAVFGHRGSDAFDGRPDSYWLSVGNGSPTADYSFEWIQADCKGNEVNTIQWRPYGSGYEVYVSVYENGAWQGTSTVPYNPNAGPAHPNDSNRPYVMRATAGAQPLQTIKLPRAYKAKYVRLCFTKLYDSNLGTFQYRAGVREFECKFIKGAVSKPGNASKPGVLGDWSEAIKELVSWAGFTWYDAPEADPLLGVARDGKNLRAWGDFELLGAGPVRVTPQDQFLNKSFMDAINTIKDFIGCVFWVDASGGAIFNMPNIFTGGNFIHDPDARSDTPAYVKDHPIEFHENANLLTYQVRVDDSQLRSEVVVVGSFPDTNSTGYVAGGYVLGKNSLTGTASAIDFTNVLAGQQRLMMVPPDQTKGFTQQECQRMAELVALFILFTYRRGSLTAPCHPGLQLDDQVRIYERMTNEFFIHYVSRIETELNLKSGSYTMTLDTHWLGDDPDRQWFVNKAQLTPAVLQIPAILKRGGRV